MKLTLDGLQKAFAAGKNIQEALGAQSLPDFGAELARFFSLITTKIGEKKSDGTDWTMADFELAGTRLHDKVADVRELLKR